MTGESENKNNSVAVKNLKTGEQVEVRREHLVSQIQNSKETKR
jgi:histidyl-tRNA synthetase